jgi:long-chain acyl-CoA synthetase
MSLDVPTARGATAGAATVADLVTRMATRTPRRLAFVDSARRVSWVELDEAIDAYAEGLRDIGLQPGDRLALQLPNSVTFVEVYLGALRAGLSVVPINPAYTVTELRAVLADCTARILVTASAAAVEAAESLQQELPELNQVITAVTGGSAEPDGPRPLTELKADTGGDIPTNGTVDPEDIAVILYTSGTSAAPKGAMLSHRALLANIEQVTSIQPPLSTSHDVVLLPVPLCHIYGLNAGLGMVLAHGSTAVLVEKFETASSLGLISEEGVSVLLGAPAMFAAWASAPDFAARVGRVRFALSGSAPLLPELVARYAKAGVPLHEGYGLTEASPVVTLNAVMADGASRVGETKPGSVGVAIPGVEIGLRDANGDPVAEDDPGQVAVRGKNLFSGYWPDGRNGPDEDGWFVTGDLGYLDGDGDLVLVGRESEMVLVNGFNVFPSEIETVLGGLDGVADVAVLGAPDETTGEAVLAFVVAEPGRVLIADELLAGAASSLARFKLPTRIEIVDELPHTITGKVKKWQLRR